MSFVPKRYWYRDIVTPCLPRGFMSRLLNDSRSSLQRFSPRLQNSYKPGFQIMASVVIVRPRIAAYQQSDSSMINDVVVVNLAHFLISSNWRRMSHGHVYKTQAFSPSPIKSCHRSWISNRLSTRVHAKTASRVKPQSRRLTAR